MSFRKFILIVIILYHPDMLFSSDSIIKEEKGIVFVYNAKSGFINAMLDYGHKMLSPDTYDCQLCKLTYDNFGKEKKWHDFISSLPFEVSFKYKDDLKILGIEDSILTPAVILSDQSLLISSNEINACRSLNGLIELVRIRTINL